MPDPYLSLHPNVKLPPYVSQEYPKWVTGANGKNVIVQSRTEEARVTVQTIESDTPEPQENVLLSVAAPLDDNPVEDLGEKTKLQLQASSLGIEVDRRWGVKKLRSIIEAHS